MDEERKKLEAIGDGLLLVVARLYLRDQPNVPYKIHMRLISRMVNNQTLCAIADGEGIKGREGEKLSDAFEVAIAIRYYREGFESVRVWLCGLFDRYLDINEEVRRILEPTPEDKLSKSVRGALKMVLGQQGGKITGSTLDLATKQIVAQFRNGHSL
jgi:dsRNA-specific ribonuclease